MVCLANKNFNSLSYDAAVNLTTDHLDYRLVSLAVPTRLISCLHFLHGLYGRNITICFFFVCFAIVACPELSRTGGSKK